jgi:hypothetical protein
MQAPARRGFSVHLFLPNGDPDGIKVVEKTNWSGCGLVIPRPLYSEARARADFERAGVYALIGASEASPLPQLYIGEGDPIRPRLDQHAKAKDFWTHAVAFTSKDQSLNKAHVQHLEARLVELAAASKRCVLDNGNIPQAPSLTEADTAAVEGFLDDVLLCLPILGFDYFDAAPAAKISATVLNLSGRGIRATGFEVPKGFLVQAGSQAAKDEVPSIHAYMSDIRAELVRQGVLVDRGACFEVVQDYTFQSPSTASGVLLGRSSNGRADWKTSDGRTLKSLQDAKVDS